MSDRRPTSVRLNPEEEKALAKIGERLERSVSWLIRRAVDEYIERNREPEKGVADRE